MPARFIWSDATGEGRNCFVWFRRVVRLASKAPGTLHLFVDNRYRLRVNGVIVAYGPVRFLPKYPQFDTIDLTPYLHAGDNVLVVEAWSPNANNFQAMRESRGGFMAWGTIGAGDSGDLETPGAWECQRALAWDDQAGAFSFAQGPVEICDYRRVPSAIGNASWHAPTVITHPVWGTPTARSLPGLDMRLDAPSHLLLAARLDASEERLVARTVAITAMRERGKEQVRVPYAVCIHSPRPQTITIGTFWGPHYLNGIELAVTADPLLGNRQNGSGHLREGWNLLYGEPEVLADVWGVLVGVPGNLGLSLRSQPRLDSEAGIRIAPAQVVSQLVAARGALPTTCSDLERLPWSWQVMRDADMPAREVAWDRIGTVIARNQAASAISLAEGEHVLVYDLGSEVLGHVVIDLEAPAGTVVDCCFDERHRADGQLAVFQTNPFADTVDRLRSAGGRAVLEGFHPRGGRYVQLTIRPPRGAGQPCTVHAVGVRNGRIGVGGDGSFSCSDPVLSWAWASGVQTLRACVEDAFLDCPWRERGTYIGDALVETHALRATTRDLSVAWRTATLAGQSLSADGQIMGCVPSWMPGPAGDFSMIWVLMVRDLWAASGDLAAVTALFPAVQAVLASKRWTADVHGLWSANGANCFIDWGITAEGRKGDANGVLNALRIRAVQCAHELAKALKHPDAEHYRALADTLSESFRRVLWQPAEGRFGAHAQHAQAKPPVTAIHANVLAVAFGIATPEQTQAILGFLVPALQANAARALGDHPEYLELYYLHYTLQALYRLELTDLAEAVMRSHYLPLKNAGAWTLWEGLRSGSRGQGSLCHAWSTASMWAASDHILGVRFELPGDADRLVISPDSCLAWASGIVPHPKGQVKVSWRREGSQVWLDAELPPGVQARVQLGPALRGCTVISSIRGGPAVADARG